MDQFAAIRMFVRVVESGSFSAVAREAGVGNPPSASRSRRSKRISARSFCGEPRGIWVSRKRGRTSMSRLCG